MEKIDEAVLASDVVPVVWADTVYNTQLILLVRCCTLWLLAKQGAFAVPTTNICGFFFSPPFAYKQSSVVHPDPDPAGSEIICKLGSGSVINSGSDSGSGFESGSKLSSASN
jgi:hypothetical protein